MVNWKIQSDTLFPDINSSQHFYHQAHSITISSSYSPAAAPTAGYGAWDRMETKLWCLLHFLDCAGITDSHKALQKVRQLKKLTYNPQVHPEPIPHICNSAEVFACTRLPSAKCSGSSPPVQRVQTTKPLQVITHDANEAQGTNW